MVVLHHFSMALSAAMAAVGTALFIALNLFYKKRVWTPESDYYTFREEEEEHSEKQVLVLGLDGAGKSSVLQGLHTPACQLDFLESVDYWRWCRMRMYWVDYLKRTHILVYVVDFSDKDSGGLGKQDKPDAFSVPEPHEALSLSSVADQRKLFLLAAQLESDGLCRTCSLQKFQDLLLMLV
uniref:ADP-ribosylation factor-like protein 10 n=1 Tax=Cyprinus carpio TaxID=7962 RepID=A0A8C2EYM5_CYPCA